MSGHPIVGVFDSGVGGLSVVRALLAQLPYAEVIYVADSAHCPYGSRSRQVIAGYSVGISQYLVDQGADIIVVACNTASAAALRELRAHFEVPFVGMVPAVKPAVALTKSGTIGVLATPTTLDGRLFEDVVEHYAQGVRVLTRVCPGLVEAVESGKIMTASTRELLAGCLAPMVSEGIDTLVLGCTHYPFLEPAIRAVAGSKLRLIEPSEAIARQTEHVLHEVLPWSNEPVSKERHVFATTGDPVALEHSLQVLLGLNAETLSLAWAEGVLTRPS